jgi:polyhydroxyalkanoate synthase
MTEVVHARPLLIAPPQINKFYVFDLAPEKSIIQLALKGGLQTFAISWKNPTSAESHFGLDTYVEALEDAADVMRDITNSQDINIWGSCSGGITTSAFLGNLAARGERKVHSATVAVCVLDMTERRIRPPACSSRWSRLPLQSRPHSSPGSSKDGNSPACSPGCGPTT